MPAELLDPPEQLIDMARILPDQTAFQLKCIQLIRTVAHLSEPDQPLVGVYLYKTAVHRRTDDIGETNVRNAELGRLGIRVDMGKASLFIMCQFSFMIIPTCASESRA
jgi:hypothetical protein